MGYLIAFIVVALIIAGAVKSRNPIEKQIKRAERKAKEAAKAGDFSKAAEYLKIAEYGRQSERHIENMALNRRKEEEDRRYKEEVLRHLRRL